MKKFAFALVAMATAAVFTSGASATPISGTLAVNGSNDTWSLTQISFSHVATNATVAPQPATSGTLTTVIGDDVTLTTNPLIFASAVGKELFSTGDGVTFTISTIAVDFDDSGFLDIDGTGTLTESGYTSTLIDWSLSSTRTGTSTTYGIDLAPSSQFTQTPEPSSLLLLGSGLLGLAFVASRRAAAKSIVRLGAL